MAYFEFTEFTGLMVNRLVVQLAVDVGPPFALKTAAENGKKKRRKWLLQYLLEALDERVPVQVSDRPAMLFLSQS